MTVNTNQLNDGQYVTTSSISIVGGPSRSTLIAEDVTATSVLSSALLKLSTLTVNSTASIGGAVTLQGALTANNAATFSRISVVAGTSVNTLVVNSTISAVGQVSAGLAQFNSKVTFAGGPIILSSATTAQSASTAKVLDGQLIFSILSLTTNGAAMYLRSGNSTWVFESSGAIG